MNTGWVLIRHSSSWWILKFTDKPEQIFCVVYGFGFLQSHQHAASLIIQDADNLEAVQAPPSHQLSRFRTRFEIVFH